MVNIIFIIEYMRKHFCNTVQMDLDFSAVLYDNFLGHYLKHGSGCVCVMILFYTVHNTFLRLKEYENKNVAVGNITYNVCRTML